MIENINQELVDVASAVETVTESNRQNAESTRIVKEHFMGIASETENIGVRAAELTEVLEGLEKANNEIVDKTGASTATISRVNRALTYGADGYNRVLLALERDGKLDAQDSRAE